MGGCLGGILNAQDGLWPRFFSKEGRDRGYRAPFFFGCVFGGHGVVCERGGFGWVIW